jgi:hypothetical protein
MDPKAIAQGLAYLLAEAIDDRKYWALVAEHEMDLAPRKVPTNQIDEHVQHVVEDALRAFAADSGVRDLLHDAVMKALEGWYEPHER